MKPSETASRAPSLSWARLHRRVSGEAPVYLLEIDHADLVAPPRHVPAVRDRGDELEQALRPDLRKAFLKHLREREFDHLLFAHGAPWIGGARAGLEQFLADMECPGC